MKWIEINEQVFLLPNERERFCRSLVAEKYIDKSRLFWRNGRKKTGYRSSPSTESAYNFENDRLYNVHKVSKAVHGMDADRYNFY